MCVYIGNIFQSHCPPSCFSFCGHTNSINRPLYLSFHSAFVRVRSLYIPLRGQFASEIFIEPSGKSSSTKATCPISFTLGSRLMPAVKLIAQFSLGSASTWYFLYFSNISTHLPPFRPLFTGHLITIPSFVLTR